MNAARPFDTHPSALFVELGAMNIRQGILPFLGLLVAFTIFSLYTVLMVRARPVP